LKRIIAGVRYARRFTGEKIELPELINIIELARWAPSIGHIQPWEVIIVNEPREIKKLARLHPAGYLFEQAGALIFIVLDPDQSPHYMIDGGSLTAYIALAASIKGYAIIIVNLEDSHIYKTELGIPASKYLLGLIAIGREKIEESILIPRKPLNYIVHINRYGSRMRGL